MCLGPSPQATPLGGERATGVGKRIVARMCERNISHTECVILAEGRDGVAELMSSVRRSERADGYAEVDPNPSTPIRLAILPRLKAF